MRLIDAPETNIKGSLMKKLNYILGFLVVLLFAVPGLMAQQAATVSLDGFSHVPPVPTPGSGTVTVIAVEDTLYIEGQFQDLGSQYQSAAIHFGSPRESGNRLIGLTVSVGEDGMSGEIQREENTFTLRPAIQEALEEGDLYINIGTSRNRSGELRGQIPALSDTRWNHYEFFDEIPGL